MKNKYVVIGSGAMGTAAAKILHDGNQENIIVYGVDQEELAQLSQGANTKYFPSSSSLPNFATTSDLKSALNGATHIVLAVPSFAMDQVLSDVFALLDHEVLIINFAKGFYPNGYLSLHAGIKDKAKDNKFIKGVVSMIGPSHAEEIVKESPTLIACVTSDRNIGAEVQAVFQNHYFKTYYQKDVNGAEVGAIYKNILAIASGVAKGYGYGINTQAALLTRGLVEMQKLNQLYHGQPETIYGLTGIGDLIVTATSTLSRNYSFGINFAQNGQDALKTEKTVEGLYALEVVYKLAQEKELHLPIVKALYQLIHKNAAFKNVLQNIWSSDLKDE